MHSSYPSPIGWAAVSADCSCQQRPLGAYQSYWQIVRACCDAGPGTRSLMTQHVTRVGPFTSLGRLVKLLATYSSPQHADWEFLTDSRKYRMGGSPTYDIQSIVRRITPTITNKAVILSKPTEPDGLTDHHTVSLRLQAKLFPGPLDYATSTRPQQSLQVRKHPEVWPSCKGGPSPHFHRCYLTRGWWSALLNSLTIATSLQCLCLHCWTAYGQ